jgi:hypothetical protein
VVPEGTATVVVHELRNPPLTKSGPHTGSDTTALGLVLEDPLLPRGEATTLVAMASRFAAVASPEWQFTYRPHIDPSSSTPTIPAYGLYRTPLCPNDVQLYNVRTGPMGSFVLGSTASYAALQRAGHIHPSCVRRAGVRECE